MRRVFLTQMAAVAATIAAPRAFAQSTAFPDRPIRIIVGFAPGGSTDPIIRTLQPKLNELLGQPIVIENRPGASTSLACMAVKQAPPDGYTLLFTTGGGHAAHTIDQPQFQYDPIKDFTSISIVSRAGWAFVTHPSVPARTISEYVAYAKANPGKINFSSTGVGVLNHLAMERFNHAAGIKAIHVPYKSAATGSLDLVSGRIQAAFSARATYEQHIKDGKIRGLAYTAFTPGEFSAAHTFASAGVPELDDTDTINVLLGPANMAPALVARISGAVEKALAMPDVQASINGMQQAPFFKGPRDTYDRLVAEHAKYLRIIRAANIKMGEG